MVNSSVERICWALRNTACSPDEINPTISITSTSRPIQVEIQVPERSAAPRCGSTQSAWRSGNHRQLHRLPRSPPTTAHTPRFQSNNPKNDFPHLFSGRISQRNTAERYVQWSVPLPTLCSFYSPVAVEFELSLHAGRSNAAVFSSLVNNVYHPVPFLAIALTSIRSVISTWPLSSKIGRMSSRGSGLSFRRRTSHCLGMTQPPLNRGFLPIPRSQLPME